MTVRIGLALVLTQKKSLVPAGTRGYRQWMAGAGTGTRTRSEFGPGRVGYVKSLPVHDSGQAPRHSKTKTYSSLSPIVGVPELKSNLKSQRVLYNECKRITQKQS